MELIDTDTLERIHNRNIDISSYVFDDEHILLTGELKEKTLVTIYEDNGEFFEPHVFHHMQIQLLIRMSDLKIVGIKAKMPEIPEYACREVENSLDEIEGLIIAPGFTSKVKKIAGGIKGCIHLTTLLLSMAPAVLQGYWIFNAKDKNNKEEEAEFDVGGYLIDTCRVWRKDGPMAEAFMARNRKD